MATLTKARETVRTAYLRPGEAARLLGVGRTTFWRLRKDTGFPKPRHFAGAARFNRDELLTWADAQLADTSIDGQRSA